MDNQSKLREAEEKFGVPPEIITAIIGVETYYGKNSGSYRVIDSLNTLAFHYPKRAAFFRSELEHFLLFSREQNFNPEELKGSYAGATVDGGKLTLPDAPGLGVTLRESVAEPMEEELA